MNSRHWPWSTSATSKSAFQSKIHILHQQLSDDDTVAIHAILRNSMNNFGFTNGLRTFELNELEQDFEAASGSLPAYLKLSKTIEGKLLFNNHKIELHFKHPVRVPISMVRQFVPTLAKSSLSCVDTHSVIEMSVLLTASPDKTHLLPLRARVHSSTHLKLTLNQERSVTFNIFRN